MAALLGDLASEPGAHRFYMWNMGANVSGQVSHYLEGTQVQQPGTTVMLSTYTLVHDQCGYTATPAIAARYEDFMHQVAEGIGNFHVVFFLELDSLITAPCLTHQQLAIREAELRYAISALEADPHVVVYIDAGAADAVHYPQMATWLRASGVAQAQGFFLNSTHFDWTTSEIHYGQQISRRLGGTHFVVNTGSNGKGPLVPKRRVGHGNEVLCNPPGRGLGPLTLSGDVAQQTGYAATDGLLWFSNPGGSGGQCVPGAPPTGVFWPQRAADARPQLGQQGHRAEVQPARVAVRGGARAQVARDNPPSPPLGRKGPPMRFASVLHDGQPHAVAIDGTTAIPLTDIAELGADTPNELLGDPPLDRGAAFALSEATFRPVIPRPGKVICVGLNYKAHIEETQRDDSDYPVLFTKFATSLTGAYDSIAVPPESDAVDYEGELAVVIGARARRVSTDRALDVVAGYTVANDVTMRDYQYRTHQWVQGKAWDASTPLGPALVTRRRGPRPRRADPAHAGQRRGRARGRRPT